RFSPPLNPPKGGEASSLSLWEGVRGRAIPKNSMLPSIWFALTVVVAYLLSPHLQAANIADFHADPFVVTPLLFAVWYASQQRWGWMWLWAIIAMSSKETLPTLTAMLGVWVVVRNSPPRCVFLLGGVSAFNTSEPNTSKEKNTPWRREIKHALALILVSTLWFYIATFWIVAPLAEQYFGTDGPIYLANRYTNSMSLFDMLQQPVRWYYLLGLLASFGFLSLAAPEGLILGLPVLLANFFSNFAGQYSGEQHYSAPLVVALAVSTIYGMARLMRYSRQPVEVGIYLCLWLLTWSVGYHALHGWTPLSLRTEHYAMTPAAQTLPNLVDQIPAEAVVSASPGLHPHIAHRRVAYIFPIVEQADYLLVDVTDISGMHPYDVQNQLSSLLETDWQVLTATHGLLLAERSSQATTKPLPDSFFEFARLSDEMIACQTFNTHSGMWELRTLKDGCVSSEVRSSSEVPYTPIQFGDKQLQLLDYDYHDDPDDGVTLRFYWRALTDLPPDLQLWPLIYDDSGRLLSDPTQVPMIATVWYPPERWSTDEIIVTETLPQHLPDSFHVGMAVGEAGRFYDLFGRWESGVLQSHTSEELRTSEERYQALIQPNRWVQVASFTRQGAYLFDLPPRLTHAPLHPIESNQVNFANLIQLTGYQIESSQPDSLSIRLRWLAQEPPPVDYTVFIHLFDHEGNRVSQNDQYPTWIFPAPTSLWPADQPMLDQHHLALPDELSVGQYTIKLGLYDATTLERLRLSNGEDVYELSSVNLP
ncbi:DUF2079 domain-containing protein, partial [Anaerolineales bacterium HSG6]|nr:DUF2079 domain-containing protein [Anaerolineales bacterium HSG6]